MREVPMREFYKNMKKFIHPSVVGEGIIVTRNKRPAFVVSAPAQKTPFRLSRLKNLQAKRLPKDLSTRIDEILYGKKQ